MSEEKVIEDFLARVGEGRGGATPADADTAVAPLIGIVGGNTPLKPRAIEALAKCDWPLAVSFLSALTPPGMVFVPAGEFTMGSNEDDLEKPPHKVWVDSYYIDRGPVTNAQFALFWEDVSYAETSEAWNGFEDARKSIYATELRRAPYYWFDPDWNPRERPVVGLSWYEAVVYARWSGKRLPTEAEWEKAARGTDARRYPWGDNFDPERTNSNLSPNAANTTTAAGQFSPQGDSPYGAQDMSGNIWEWTSSAARPYPYDAADGREELSIVQRRILRGGGYRSNFEDHYRSAHRWVVDPTYIFITVGLRCAATVPPPMRL